MTNELLPCPFCGQEVALEVSHVLEDGITRSAYVYCAYCGAEGQRISPHSIANAKLPEGVYAGLEMLDAARAEADQAAVDAWNTRASLTDECSGCVHCHKGADWETCQSCARNWHDKYEVAQ